MLQRAMKRSNFHPVHSTTTVDCCQSRMGEDNFREAKTILPKIPCDTLVREHGRPRKFCLNFHAENAISCILSHAFTTKFSCKEHKFLPCPSNRPNASVELSKTTICEERQATSRQHCLDFELR